MKTEKKNVFKEKPLAKARKGNQEEAPKLLYKKPDHAPVTTIYVGNLSYKRSEEEVKSLFARYGYVRSVKIVLRPGTELRSGVAFVQMTNADKALAAIKDLDGRIVDDRTLKVSIANDRFKQIAEKITQSRMARA